MSSASSHFEKNIERFIYCEFFMCAAGTHRAAGLRHMVQQNALYLENRWSDLTDCDLRRKPLKCILHDTAATVSMLPVMIDISERKQIFD